VAAPIHPADEGDTTTLSQTLEAAAHNLDAVGLAPSQEAPSDVATDKGYPSREQLKALEDGVWKTRIAEPEPAKGYLRWHGDMAARKAVYANRTRLKSGIGRETMRRRGDSSSGRSPTSSIAAACGELGCADVRTSTSAI
jgi:hypothetical protein